MLLLTKICKYMGGYIVLFNFCGYGDYEIECKDCN